MDEEIYETLGKHEARITALEKNQDSLFATLKRAIWALLGILGAAIIAILKWIFDHLETFFRVGGE